MFATFYGIQKQNMKLWADTICEEMVWKMGCITIISIYLPMNKVVFVTPMCHNFKEMGMLMLNIDYMHIYCTNL